MCGISGEFRFDGRPADVAATARMSERMAARGPNGSGLWASEPVALGHRRLSIIDLSARGGQPMVDSELGLTAVFNGCLYNYQQLRAELAGRGHRFFSSSDTEVLVKAYAEWGPGCVRRSRACSPSPWSNATADVWCSPRDRLGIKPLYLSSAPGRLRFASTLPSLLAAGGVDTSIDTTALHHSSPGRSSTST